MIFTNDQNRSHSRAEKQDECGDLQQVIRLSGSTKWDLSAVFVSAEAPPPKVEIPHCQP